MPKSRDWPLTDAERDLANEAWQFAASSLTRVNARFPGLANEIESELAYQICTNIHRWDRRRLLSLWAIFRLRKSVSLVLRRQPCGDRCREPESIGLGSEDAPHSSRRDYDDLINEATERLPARTAAIVRLAAEGHSRVEIAQIIGIEKSNVFKHLSRAKPIVTEALI